MSSPDYVLNYCTNVQYASQNIYYEVKVTSKNLMLLTGDIVVHDYLLMRGRIPLLCYLLLPYSSFNMYSSTHEVISASEMLCNG